MPNRWPISSGNWSNAAIWSGSLIPTASDDVFSNNFTVNIDTSFQVLTLRSAASASAVAAGGSFVFNSGSISGSVTDSDPLRPGATNLIQVTATSGTVGLSLGGSVAPRATASDILINHSGNCNLNLSGSNFNIGNIAGSPLTCISKTSAGTINIIGNLNGGGTSTTSQVALSSNNGNTFIIGNITGGSSNLNRAVSQTAGNITVTGNITGGGSTNCEGINFTGNQLAVNGTVTGGVNSNGIGTSAPLNIINGTVTGGTGVGIASSTANQINVSGSVIASANANAISSTAAAGVVILDGNMFNNAGKQAIYCQNLFLSDTGTTQAQFFTSGSQDRTLYSANTFPNLPSGSNVRSTTSYGPGNELLGSLIMPDPANVRYGVPTDNTTGSALLSAENLFNEIATSNNPVAVRLRNSSTTNTVGNLLTAFKK